MGYETFTILIAKSFSLLSQKAGKNLWSAICIIICVTFKISVAIFQLFNCKNCRNTLNTTSMFTFNAKTSGIVSKHSISSYVAYQIAILRDVDWYQQF